MMCSVIERTLKSLHAFSLYVSYASYTMRDVCSIISFFILWDLQFITGALIYPSIVRRALDYGICHFNQEKVRIFWNILNFNLGEKHAGDL